ncbi:MAG: formamidopyrimidine-DNA glycosylase [Gemmatimonas sp. SG8_38_2]|nr:MAG: formamidopyrimidine-DNA glycosylase [Gemmatimonas sp. SG8_38_2]
MPELPEVTAYVEALERKIVGRPLEQARIRSPSLLKTFEIPMSSAEGKTVRAIRRIGKRIVWEMDADVFLVFHLMLAGRMRWKKRGVKIPKKGGHAAFDFAHGAILLTEASTKKRASLHLVRGAEALVQFERGGIDPLAASAGEFRAALIRENRTLKRVLTDPRLFSGIGNAHSDEILLAARLSPVKRTHQLEDDEVKRLRLATRESLLEWIERLRAEVGEAFPDKVTAFHPAMKAHGKYGEPCPQCGSPIQRIVYAANEVNYCAACQTGGKLLKDRALSRILGEDWPRSLDELEEVESGLP